MSPRVVGFELRAPVSLHGDLDYNLAYQLLLGMLKQNMLADTDLLRCCTAGEGLPTVGRPDGKGREQEGGLNDKAFSTAILGSQLLAGGIL